MSAPVCLLTIGPTWMAFRLPFSLLPNEGECVELGESPSVCFGGSGANMAMAASKLGARSILCSAIGQDANGDQLKEALAQNHVDTRFVTQMAGKKTPFHVTLAQTGKDERQMLYPGDAIYPDAEQIAYAFSSQPDAVCLRGELPMVAMSEAVRIATSKQVPLSVCVSHCHPTFTPEALPPLELFSATATAVKQLTGITPGGTDSCLKAVLQLTDRIKAKYYVFSLGDRGCFMYDGKMAHHISPYYSRINDPSGASDAFDAMLQLTYFSGKSITEACEEANAAFAITALRYGTVEAMPTPSDMTLFKSHASRA